MKEYYAIRTDFADEAEALQETHASFTHTQKQAHGIKTHYISIKEKENPLGKEIGEYISIQFEQLYDQKDREQIIKMTCEQLHQLLKDMKLDFKKALVVGLGNPFITSDALGPQVIHDILVTSHYYRYEDKELLEGTREVAAIQPGVMGQTGLETFDIVKAIAQDFQPDVVFVIDALATKNIDRINRVIQINNTGIAPGSGVGNHRLALNQETLHVPVIAIGIATVTSVGAILKEAMHKLNDKTFQEITTEHFDLIVTPKSMDDELKHLVYLLSESLNRVLHPDFLSL